jgi:hypothetical protein
VDVTAQQLRTLTAALWLHRTGDVRAAFVNVVGEVRQRTTGRSLAAAQRDRLQAVADQLFSSARLNYQPDEELMERLWRMALQ